MIARITQRSLRATLRAGAGLLACLMLYLLFLHTSGNFHVTVPGELYRSAQLQPGDLAELEQQYHIRSELNLRGAEPNQEWYRDELKEAAASGVVHRDFKMSSSKELTEKEALALIQTMRDMPKPLLIHCRAGADRTGLAAAFYMAAIAHKGEWAAEEQLWIQNGHVPLWFTSAFAMNRTFERMEPILGFPDS